jgi:hypothetical protein
LSNQPDPSDIWWGTFYNGESDDFEAALSNGISGTDYGFSLWLGAGTEPGHTGTWKADIIVDHSGVQTTLATHSFSVPFDTLFVEYTANVTGIAGGTAGDTIIVRMTLTGVSEGAVLFGAVPYDSHVLVPGSVTVSLMPSMPAVSSAGESGVKAEVVPNVGRRVRYAGR